MAKKKTETKKTETKKRARRVCAHGVVDPDCTAPDVRTPFDVMLRTETNVDVQVRASSGALTRVLVGMGAHDTESDVYAFSVDDARAIAGALLAAAEDASGETADDHVRFLTTTLIPDLRESGSDFMADDFQRCVDIIRSLRRASRARKAARR